MFSKLWSFSGFTKFTVQMIEIKHISEPLLEDWPEFLYNFQFHLASGSFHCLIARQAFGSHHSNSLFQQLNLLEVLKISIRTKFLY